MNTIKTRNETITFNDLPQKNDQFTDFYHFSNAVRSIQTLRYFFHYYQKKKLYVII